MYNDNTYIFIYDPTSWMHIIYKYIKRARMCFVITPPYDRGHACITFGAWSLIRDCVRDHTCMGGHTFFSTRGVK